MSQFTNYKLILEELDHTLSHIQDEQYDRFANDVNGAQRIFTAVRVVQDLWQIVLLCDLINLVKKHL